MSCKIKNLPKSIEAGYWKEGHVQGICLDKELKYIYYSFTTCLVKSDLQGNIIGSVKGITGHLGCIDFNDEDGKVYGSIEYKHDSIGAGIMARTGVKIADENAFYIAIFDVSKIDRLNMDAEKDGIMKAVYLPEVVADFSAKNPDGTEHKYACSGIDGTTIGPKFGCEKAKPYTLKVAYGIYGDVNRTDNDYQVILEYDLAEMAKKAEPLKQGEPHHSGVDKIGKYFVYTGNTDWGVQNLEYDDYTGDYFMCVYIGYKKNFPNAPMYVIDNDIKPELKELKGIFPKEEGMCLTLKKEGDFHKESGVWSRGFNMGSTGFYSIGNGYFYVSHEDCITYNVNEGYVQTSHVKLYKFTGRGKGFKLVK